MKYVICSQYKWGEYPYKKLLEYLPELEALFFVGHIKEHEMLSNEQEIIAISPEELKQLPTHHFTVIVSSPYWLSLIAELQFKHVISFAEQCPEDHNVQMWTKQSGLCAAKADMICTTSERIYLEQTFRYDHVFLLKGEGPAAFGVMTALDQMVFLPREEAIVSEAIAALIKGNSSSIFPRKQWEARAEYYQSLLKDIGYHETVCYLLASYQYLLGQSQAAASLAYSFELMLLNDYVDCLESHYRFFSAMEASQGELERAIQIYEITAFSEGEKRNVLSMKQYVKQGELALCKAEIFVVNEDYRNAINTLLKVTTPEAKRRLLQLYLLTYQWEKALALLPELVMTEAEKQTEAILQAQVDAVHNRKHQAVQSLLRASMQDWNVLTVVNEMIEVQRESELMVGRLRYDE